MRTLGFAEAVRDVESVAGTVLLISVGVIALLVIGVCVLMDTRTGRRMSHQDALAEFAGRHSRGFIASNLLDVGEATASMPGLIMGPRLVSGYDTRQISNAWSDDDEQPIVRPYVQARAVEPFLLGEATTADFGRIGWFETQEEEGGINRSRGIDRLCDQFEAMSFRRTTNTYENAM
ncbi:hypothetical protein [Actinocrispum wychmicini]|uniref:hypothetical protein n=1 Tax=Actinocrispum wychmicini TaxID=1213861 RepID=UPI00104545C9|nr:hypothetical protein [Actinocrispum wychmicini]